MYEIKILRVNSMGGVTRGKRRANNPTELLHWIKEIVAQSDTLIEFTVTTTGASEE